MPSKKKKYNARFPAGRIKKIMQSDEDVGKVAQAVPIIISRTLELFVESMLTKTLKITSARNAKTLSPSHMKQCIMSESQFDFLRELVKNVPDINMAEEQMAADDYTEEITTPLPQTNHATHSNGSGTASGSGTSSQHRLTKQYSMDSAPANRPINFYGSATIETDSNPVNYSINGKAKSEDKPPLPKLLRIESTPASFQSSGTASSPTITTPQYVPITTTKRSVTDHPIINFDFSQFPIMPSSSNHSATSKQETQSQAVKVTQRQTSTNKSSATKTTSQISSIASSTITSTPSLSNTSVPSSVPLVSYQLSTVSNPSTLEMDEDYDDI